VIQRSVACRRPAEEPQAKACSHSEAVEAILAFRGKTLSILLSAHTIGQRGGERGTGWFGPNRWPGVQGVRRVDGSSNGAREAIDEHL
jgi:hypothetical protein